MFLFFLNISECYNHTAIKNAIDKSYIYECVIRKIRDKFHLHEYEYISLNCSPLGKKYFKFRENMMYFSISYSCGYCVFVLSLESEVGIDLELIRDKRPDFYMNVMNQSFSDEEKQRMNDEINADFFWETWTIKEAVVKYSGVGLSYDLKKISHQGHVVYWADASESLSLVKIRLGQCVIALLAESGCGFEIETPQEQQAEIIKTTTLPVLQFVHGD